MLLRWMFSDICNEGPPDKPMEDSVTYCLLSGEEGTLLYRPSRNPSSTRSGFQPPHAVITYYDEASHYDEKRGEHDRELSRL